MSDSKDLFRWTERDFNEFFTVDPAYYTCYTYKQYEATGIAYRNVESSSYEYCSTEKSVYRFFNRSTNKYNILGDMNNMNVYESTRHYSHIINKKAGYCVDLNIPYAYELIEQAGGAYSCLALWLKISAHERNGRLYASKNREMTRKDLLELAGTTKQVLSRDLKTLDAAGLVRAYHPANNRKTLSYRVNPVYWNISSKKDSKCRKIDAVDFILFFNELEQYLDDSQHKKQNITTRDLIRIAYYELFPAKLDALKEAAEKEEETPLAVDAAAETEKKDPLTVFNTYILRGKAPALYHKKRGMTRTSKLSLDEDMYYLVNETANPLLSYDGSNKPKDSAITSFRAFYVDLDAGKDENNKYFSGADLSDRKALLKNIIDNAPVPTSVVETRNGYHVLYAVKGELSDVDEWKRGEMALHDAFAGICDPSVKDASRVLRMPGSNWIKKEQGLPKFKVNAIAGNEVSYTADSLIDALENGANREEFDRLADAYRTAYPAPVKKAAKAQAKKVSASNKNISIAYHADSTRIDAISRLSTDTFAIPAAPTYVADYPSYERANIDLAEFLGIVNSSNFCDIFHDDKNPSASIYQNTAGKKEYRYVCASASSPVSSRGYSIIDVVIALAHCSAREAIVYIAKLYNLRYSATVKKAA